MTTALRGWRAGLSSGTELVTSELARLEITRTLHRAGVDLQRVPFYVAQAVRGVHLMDLTSTVMARAVAYQTRRIGSLDHTAGRPGSRPLNPTARSSSGA